MVSPRTWPGSWIPMYENYVSRLLNIIVYYTEYNGQNKKKQDMLSKTKTYYRKPRDERVGK